MLMFWSIFMAIAGSMENFQQEPEEVALKVELNFNF